MDTVLLCQGSSCTHVPDMAEDPEPCWVIAFQMFPSLLGPLRLLGDTVFQITGRV